MLKSMTALAAGTGSARDVDWAWDLRSVNARGLDIRLRVPDWLGALESDLRGMLKAALARGSVTLSLKTTRAAGQGDLDPASVDRALSLIVAVGARAAAQGIVLAPPDAIQVMTLGAGQGARDTPDDHGWLRAALMADFRDKILPDFLATRAAEGAALRAVLSDQIDRIADLTSTAAAQAGDRAPRAAEALTTALARLRDAAPEIDPDRMAQELALIAVKSDVTEEIDRLGAHVAAARSLLDLDAPVGRKLDFLSQEFNREANTLCAKSQDSELTATGLELKAVIDQFREQIQNVE